MIQNIAEVSLGDIEIVTILFRKHKNNVNGEMIPYYKDMVNPAFFPVNAALNIIKRAHRLQVPPEEPIGVYHSTTGRHKDTCCFITADQTASFLQQVAKTVF